MPTNLLAYGNCGLLRASALILSASSELSDCTVFVSDMEYPPIVTTPRIQDTKSVPSGTPLERPKSGTYKGTQRRTALNYPTLAAMRSTFSKIYKVPFLVNRPFFRLLFSLRRPAEGRITSKPALSFIRRPSDRPACFRRWPGLSKRLSLELLDQHVGRGRVGPVSRSSSFPGRRHPCSVR